MRHHHYMKYLFVLLLFLPTSLIAQNKEEKMPGHITKIQKLEDVNVTGNRPHFIRLKGYYRSYQTNDSVMKYFNDGIVGDDLCGYSFSSDTQSRQKKATCAVSSEYISACLFRQKLPNRAEAAQTDAECS